MSPRPLTTVEALTGLLIGGLSTGFSFALVTSLIARAKRTEGP
jgi:hypothetical protein